MVGPRTRLALREDVAIFAVREADPEVRAELACDTDDFVVSQSRGRSPAVLVDARTAELLRLFGEPRTLADAVILLCRGHELEPEEVLEQVWPVLERFHDRGLLVDAEAGEDREVRASFRPGQRTAGLTVLCALQVLDDGELYQVRLPEATVAALKLSRPGRTGPGSLEQEARILRRLAGEVAPGLLRRGELDDGRSYLLLEWCRGVSAQEAAREWRARPGAAARVRLLALCRRVARAYARLHDLGVLHGDVHAHNVLVDAEERVRLIDFGLARRLDDPPPETGSRPGVPFFYEPEHARARLAGKWGVAASAAGEQFAVAALLYFLATGTYYCDFGLERQDLFRCIAEMPPAAFADRSLLPWPDLEEVLGRALAKLPEERYPSMAAFAAALEGVAEPVAGSGPRSPETSLWERSAESFLRDAGLDGSWLRTPFPFPAASVSHGAAGVAYALYRIACLRDDPSVLSLADVWSYRARAQVERPESFYDEDQGYGRRQIGGSSPYHTPSGVFAVEAMIARARGDRQLLNRAIEGFVTASQPAAEELDLTLGRAGTLVVGALLADLSAATGGHWRERLTELGNRTLDTLWGELAERPAIRASDVLGMAHGWAGSLYAVLRWCRACGTQPPDGLAGRLRELAARAEPGGRGLRWRWSHGGGASYMAGWCHGSAGYVFLWSLAGRLLEDPIYDELARGAAWDAGDAGGRGGSLCCGLAGRAYALLHAYRYMGESHWLERARELARRAALEGRFDPDYPRSLYKGRTVLAVLAADLERPDEAALPFFEEEGWTS